MMIAGMELLCVVCYVAMDSSLRENTEGLLLMQGSMWEKSCKKMGMVTMTNLQKAWNGC